MSKGEVSQRDWPESALKSTRPDNRGGERLSGEEKRREGRARERERDEGRPKEAERVTIARQHKRGAKRRSAGKKDSYEAHLHRLFLPLLFFFFLSLFFPMNQQSGTGEEKSKQVASSE